VIQQGKIELNVGQILNKVECIWLVSWQYEDISLVEDSNYFWKEELRM